VGTLRAHLAGKHEFGPDWPAVQQLAELEAAHDAHHADGSLPPGGAKVIQARMDQIARNNREHRRLEAVRAAAAVSEYLREREMAAVSRRDLDALLAHYYDEVLGSPAPGHWRVPGLRAAADRLADATRPPDPEVPAEIRPEPRA
jgi:hypothetical protein